MARLLVIDDDPGVRSIMVRILERQGHEVDQASEGGEGLRLVMDNDYALVITDLVMPGKEGIETILELRSEYPDLPILAVSGGLSVDKTGPLSDAAQLGANATLEKPFTTEGFLAAVNGLLSPA
jgi:DNA-binding response OmpR family regulator